MAGGSDAMQMQLHFGLSDAERAAYDAAYWVRDNREAFKALMAVIHRQVDMGNPCVKQGEIESYIRQSGMKLDVLGEFSHNRNLYPGLTRYMVMLRPRLARSIRFRKSKLDGIDLIPIWHEVVDPRTVFLAKDRFEAEHLVETGDAGAA